MRYGVKYRSSNGWLVIQVTGYPRMRYLYYSMREAEARYRREFGLVRKHIRWEGG